jgi:predicted ribonuclease toxin of YeeF-YezG toxin-antitoxin module
MSLICEGDKMRINMGSGSAGDTQTYDAEELITAAKAHAKHYQTLRDQFHTLRTAFQQISGLGSDFQGHGADAIKAFYAAQVNVVDAWLRLIDEKIAYFQGVAGTINDKNLGGDTQVHVPFLNEDLSMGYAHSKEMVREQRDDIAKILSSISDLVPINVFSNHDVDQALDAADKKRAKMALDVQDLDQSLTNEYRQITEDLPHIQALYGELIHATRQGADVQPMHFNATAYHDSKIYQVQDEMQKETQTYLEIKEQQEQARHVSKKDTQPVNPLLANATKAVIMDQEIQYGIRDGAKDTVKDTVLGIWDAATNPVETFKATWYASTHPIQTFNIIKNALVQSFDKNMIHGNAYTRSRWVTYAFATLVTSVVGTKGVDKIGKVAKAGKIGEAVSKARMVTKATLAKHGESVNNKLNEWSTPLFPRAQFANGPIPYNVIDTKGLRNKLQQLPERNDPLTNQIDHVRDLIQQASIRKIGDSANDLDLGTISPDTIRKVDNNILDKMEASGGHTLERHVAQKNENLIKRANQENVTSATSYTNKKIALKATKDSIRFHSDDIALWLNTTKSKRAIFVTAHNFSIGNGVLQGKKQVIYDLHYSKLVVERDDSQKAGFRIISSFPIVTK